MYKKGVHTSTMMNMLWFSSPFQGEISGLTRQLQANGFKQKEDFWEDGQGRRVEVPKASGDPLKLGIPSSDLVSEQEQLEFLLGLLGLEDDDIQSV